MIECMVALLCAVAQGKDSPRHYVFFGMDREKLSTAASFFATPAFEGAQISYSWRQLEPQKDEYDFSLIREDLALLEKHGKRLWIQIQDASFTRQIVPMPKYLLNDPEYHGGAAQQTEKGEPHGWVARRWDPAVQARLYKLFDALGKAFDGRITGINLDETSVGEYDQAQPSGFTFRGYVDAVIANMGALKRAFPRSIALQYANFMPGEWRPLRDENRGYLDSVYAAARRIGVGVGGPDLLPTRRGQLGSSYPLIHEIRGAVPVGIAVQDGNLAEVNPATGKRVTVSELLTFATEYLRADFIFWGTEEPYFSEQVVPTIAKTRGGSE